MKRAISIAILILLSYRVGWGRTFTIRGEVVDSKSRSGVPYVAVSVEGQPGEVGYKWRGWYV